MTQTKPISQQEFSRLLNGSDGDCFDRLAEGGFILVKEDEEEEEQ